MRMNRCTPVFGSEMVTGPVTPCTGRLVQALGLDARRFLAGHDSYGIFSALGDLVVTGPTRTNVNDYRAILIT